MNIKINGREVSCEKGEFLLQIARRNNIYIPTLCHHESLPGQGCCRVCIVEIAEQGRHKIVVSCVYPVEHEIEVFTDSEQVRRQRGIILMLLAKRAPDSTRIAEMCKMYQAPPMPRIKAADTGKCILCGLCVRACQELSVGAIASVNRGVTKEIAAPYHEPSAVCVGCGSCASVCPTDAIPVTEDASSRTIWGKQFELVRCAKCGKPIGTREELLLAARKAEQEPAVLCEICRKKEIAAEFARTYGNP